MSAIFAALARRVGGLWVAGHHLGDEFQAVAHGFAFLRGGFDLLTLFGRALAGEKAGEQMLIQPAPSLLFPGSIFLHLRLKSRPHG